jgi:two-component system response regulator GlrR
MSEGATSQTGGRSPGVQPGSKTAAYGFTSTQTGAPSELGRSGRRREDRFVAVSAGARAAVDRALLAARSDQPVLVRGPAGSGRTTLARAIHAWSPSSTGPLEVLPCAAVPEPLQARELFGCAAGTYPALPEAYPGALERAVGGTLLIEGIEDLASSVTGALGRAISSGRWRPEGSGEERPLRSRLILTAERSITDGILGVPHFEVALPPLSERREDLLPLAAHFLAQAAADEGVEPVGFTEQAQSGILEEAWPGNVAELRERVRQAVRISRNGAISAEALLLAAPSDRLPSFREAKRAFEARYVETVLRLCGGNISQAARLAQKDRKDFYDVIRRTGIDPMRFRR